MSQWNLIIDVARCENCNNCVLANKDEYVGNDFPGYAAAHALQGDGTLTITRHVRGEGHMVDVAYVPRMCNHCDNAPCIAAAGPGVITKRPDGIVVIDPKAAAGRKDLVTACPYGAIVWNEEKQVPQNWIFDAHLLDQGWSAPRCAHSCPTDAIAAVKTDAAGMAALVREQSLKVLSPEFGTRPRVYYKNLHRFDSYFIGGSVVGTVKGRLECLAGAKVRLSHGGQLVQSIATDAFGDFKFDGLDRETGRFAVTIQHQGFPERALTVEAGATRFLGEIALN